MVLSPVKTAGTAPLPSETLKKHQRLERDTMTAKHADARLALLNPFTPDEPTVPDENRDVPAFHWPLE
jgi:hypothetical protein